MMLCSLWTVLFLRTSAWSFAVLQFQAPLTFLCINGVKCFCCFLKKCLLNQNVFGGAWIFFIIMNFVLCPWTVSTVACGFTYVQDYFRVGNVFWCYLDVVKPTYRKHLNLFYFLLSLAVNLDIRIRHNITSWESFIQVKTGWELNIRL